MPLLRKQPFQRKKPSPDFRDNDKLFYCELTCEVFKDYEEFCQRIILCNSLIWSCELTGKSGLTYQEAQASEENARKSIRLFPMELRAPLLFIASLTKRSSFLELAEDVFLYARDRYFIGEYVEIILSNHDFWVEGQILKVLPPSESIVSRSRLTKPHDKEVPALFRYEVEKIDAIYDDEISEIHVLESHRIRRKKGIYTREKSRLFIKHCMKQTSDGLWVLRENFIRQYELRTAKFSHFFAGPQPVFDQSKKIRKLSESPTNNKQKSGQKKTNNVLKNHKKQESIEKYFKGNKKAILSKHQALSPSKASPKKSQKNVINKVKKKYQNLANSQKDQAKKINNVNQAKNKTLSTLSASKHKKLEDLIREREQEREAAKQRKIQERLRLREKQKEDKLKLAAFMREWNRQREDLECEDLQELPCPLPLRCDIPDECFGDFVMVLEFLHSFKLVLQSKNFFPNGTVSFELAERALTASEVDGPLADLIHLLLQSVFNMQEEEDDEISDTKDLTDTDNMNFEILGNVTYSSAIRAATAASSWSQLFYGVPVNKLNLDCLTITEVLRLHLLSSGGRSGEMSSQWRYQQRGGYTSADDPGLQLRLEHPDILHALSIKSVYELSIGYKLKVLTCLINQLLTYALVRDVIDEKGEQIRQIKLDLKASQAAELKREREIAALKSKEKKEAKQKLAVDNAPSEGGESTVPPPPPLVLTPEEQEKKAAEEEAAKLKMEKEVARKKQEWQKKISEMQSIAMGFQLLPLGRDRAYRRFWTFSSLPGLFVENDEQMLGPCLPKATPPADPSLMRYEDTLSYVKKLFEEEQNGGSDKENDSGNIVREVPRLSFSPNKKLLSERNDSDCTVLQTSTTISVQSNEKVGNFDELILPHSFVCTANHDCPVHGVNIVRTKWAFYCHEDDVTNLIKSLNRRGVRESELRQVLIQEQERILKSVSLCPVSKLDKFKAVEEQPEQRKTRAAGPKYDNPNLDYPPETPVEDVLELTLRDTILELENKIEMGGLGSLKVFDREAWIKALNSRSYDMQCNILNWGKNSSRKAQNDVSNVPDEQQQQNLDEEGGKVSNDADEEEPEVLADKSSVIQKPVMRDLASAILQVEQSVEKKYLIKPLGAEDGKSKNSDENKINKWASLHRWENYLMASTSFAQLFLHIATLENSIEWSRSALNAFCRLCRKRGDPENMLLCDECNKGHHLYCLKPKLTKVPSGDWFCQKCRPGFKVRPAKRSRKIFSEESDDENDEQECSMCRGEGELVKCKTCLKKYHPDCVIPPLQKIPRTGTWNCHKCQGKEFKTEESTKSRVSDSRSQRRRNVLNEDREPRQRRCCATAAVVNISKFAKRLRSESWDEESSVQSDDGQADSIDSQPSRRSYRKSRDINHDLPLNNAVLQDLLTEVMHHEDAWPFLWPVQKSKVPDYYNIIKNPMDLGTVKNKLNMLEYTNNNEFIADTLLIFENCETYNSSDSDEYKAGTRLSRFFKKRCKQLGLSFNEEEIKQNTAKRPRLS